MLFKSILRHRKIYAAMFIWAMFLGCLPLNANALPVDSKAEVAKSYQEDLNRVANFLEEEAVAQKLSKLGLSPKEIQSKLDSLDEYQVRKLANRIESLEKGSGGVGIALAIITILLILISFLYFTNRRITVEKTYE